MEEKRLVMVGAVLISAVGLAVLLLLTVQGSADVFGSASVSAAPAAAPTVTAVDPPSAPNDLDTAIVITGTNFEAGAGVQLGGTPLPEVNWVSDTRLEATVPWGLDPGVYTVTVVNPGGESGSLSNAFTVTQAIGAWATGGPYGGNVNQIAIHAITPTTVYAAAPAAGIFRSRDGADNWEVIFAGAVDETAMSALAVAPDADVLYVQSIQGVLRSDDGGDTWTSITRPGSGGLRLYPHPILSNTVYATVGMWHPEDGGVFRSDDRGQTWITLTNGLTDTQASALAFHPTDPLTMVVGTWNGNIFRSTDGGASWTFASRPLGNIWRLVPNPYGGHEVWAAVDGRWGDPCATLKSANAELTAWTQVSDKCSWSIRFAPPGWGQTYSQTVFLAAWGEILRTDDGGDSWTSVTPINYNDVALHPTNPAVMMAVGDGLGVQRSLDGGATWAAAVEGLTAIVPPDLAVDPERIETLYALGSAPGTILKSDSGGETWQTLMVAENAEGAGSVLVDPFQPSRVYVGGDPIYISTDGGLTWPVTATLPAPDQYAHCPGGGRPTGALMIADPATPGVLLGGVQIFCGDWSHTYGGLYRSADYGEHWAWVDLGWEFSGVIDLTYDPGNPSLVYVATQHDGILRSTDGGLTWAPSNAGLGGDDIFISSVAVEPSPPHRVFAARDGEVFLSANEGISWTQVQGPPYGLAWRGLVFAPGDPPVLYAATNGGLYREVGGTLDSLRWQAAAGSLGRVNVASLAVGTDGERVVLYAGTSGATAGGTMVAQSLTADGASVSAGVYRYTLPPLPSWEQVNTNGFGDPANFLIGTLDTFGGWLYAGTWRNDERGAQVWRTADGRTWSQFTPSWSPSNTVVYDAQVFGSRLYFGTGHDYGGAGEIWRTNGTIWEQVVPAGFGDENNIGVNALAVFGNALYAATTNYATGLEVWRSPSGDAGSWSQVNSDGFGSAGTAQDVTMEVYGGHLYVGLSRDGVAELWRSDGTGWTAVFTDGLAAGNTHVSAMAEFGGEFYIALRNVTTGGEVWRSEDGLAWAPVFTRGLGNPDNLRPYGLSVVGDDLYLAFTNLATGAEVWRTASGGAWWPANESGWGDSLNRGASHFDKGMTVFRFDLYVATSHSDGGEVWRLPLAHHTYLPLVLRGYAP